VKIIDVKQGSGEWLTARLGKITASEIDCLVSPTGKVRTGDGPYRYLCRKVSERVLGWSAEDAGSFAMNQGSIVECEARPWFQFEYGLDIQTAGFCVTDDGRCGCSPDGLIGDHGGLEIKSPTPPVHMEYLLGGVVPLDYVLQVQFSLWVTGRQWWKFLSYSRQLPPLVVHVTPDPAIQEAISKAVASFAIKFDETVAKVSDMKREFFASKEAEHASRNSGR